MKRILSQITLIAALLLMYCIPAFSEMSGTQDITIRHYNVDGNKNRSFYRHWKYNYLYEGSIDYRFPGEDPAYETFGNVEIRSTDDRTVDGRDDFSPQRMVLGFKRPGSEVLLGDIYVNFSDYSVGNALKGALLTLGDQDGDIRTYLTGGIDVSEWDDIWERRSDDSVSRRRVWGARVEKDLLENKLAVNVNYGGMTDDDAFNSEWSQSVYLNVFSVDTEYEVNDKIRVYGEYGISFTDEDTDDVTIKTQDDTALQVGAEFNADTYSATAAYERVEQHFMSTSGFNATDLESWALDGNWSLPLDINFTHYLHADRDNLQKHQISTTKQVNPGLRLSFTLPGDIETSLGADIRKRYSMDKTTNDKTQSYSYEFSKDFDFIFVNVGYNRDAVNDEVNADRESITDTVSIGLDGDFEVKGLEISWNVSEDISREDFEAASKSDMSYGTSIGTRIRFPNDFEIEGRLRFNHDDFYEMNRDSHGADYSLTMSKEIIRDMMAELSYERRTHRYADPDGNYADQIIEGKLNYRF